MFDVDALNMLPRFPILWLTVLVFGIVAAATGDLLIGGFLFAFLLPTVLLCQWCIRWVFGRFRGPLWIRRGAMLLPALILAYGTFHVTNGFGGSQTAALTVALAGHTPTGIQDLHVRETAWTDYLVFAYFRCNPTSLRDILTQPPFVRSNYPPEKFSFTKTPFPDLGNHPDLEGVFTYERTDLGKARGSCTVYTDSTFSFAYVSYGVD